MNNLPEKFPEYSIMYKTIPKKIKELEERKKQSQKLELNEINSKIQNYQTELNRIKEMFPENFFD
ncbi:MAG: hypothetical protein ACE5GR_00505 [Nitrosopumilus sp.]